MLTDRRIGTGAPENTSSREHVPQENAAISSEKLQQLYLAMLHLRNIQNHESGRANSRGRVLRFSEACEVGCTIDLRREDLVFPFSLQRVNGRAKGAAMSLSRSSTLPAKMYPAPWTTLETQPSRQRLSLIAGSALAQQTTSNGAIVVAFSKGNEIAQSKDVLFLALDHCLPVVYVQFDDQHRSSKNHRTRASQLDPSFTAIPVDRTDVVAIYRVACEAIDRARRGIGPTLIQCVSWPSALRKNDPEDPHCADPITYMESYLRSRNLWKPELKDFQ